MLKKLFIRIALSPFVFFNKLQLALSKAKVGNNFETFGFILFKIYGNIKIGNGVRIISSKYLNPIGGTYGTSIQVLQNGCLHIGNNCGLSNVSITCADHIEIGDRVMIGGGVCIYDTDFHPINPILRSVRNEDPLNVAKKPVIISDDVFIGAHAIILKGSNIGKCSVIGAGSVVAGTIPENEIWAGNPARFIRKVNIER